MSYQFVWFGIAKLITFPNRYGARDTHPEETNRQTIPSRRMGYSCGCTGVWVYRCVGVQVCECTGVWVCRLGCNMWCP